MNLAAAHHPEEGDLGVSRGNDSAGHGVLEGALVLLVGKPLKPLKPPLALHLAPAPHHRTLGAELKA